MTQGNISKLAEYGLCNLWPKMRSKVGSVRSSIALLEICPWTQICVIIASEKKDVCLNHAEKINRVFPLRINKMQCHVLPVKADLQLAILLKVYSLLLPRKMKALNCTLTSSCAIRGRTGRGTHVWILKDAMAFFWCARASINWRSVCDFHTISIKFVTRLSPLTWVLYCTFIKESEIFFLIQDSCNT